VKIHVKAEVDALGIKVLLDLTRSIDYPSTGNLKTSAFGVSRGFLFSPE
jgi:hypothetical protein